LNKSQICFKTLLFCSKFVCPIVFFLIFFFFDIVGWIPSDSGSLKWKYSTSIAGQQHGRVTPQQAFSDYYFSTGAPDEWVLIDPLRLQQNPSCVYQGLPPSPISPTAPPLPPPPSPAPPPPSPPPPSTVYLYDLSYTNALNARDRFEHVHTVSALAGIVNRHRPQLFTPYLVKGGNVDGGSDADDVWLQYLVSPGEWLEHTTFQNLTTLVRTVVVHILCFHPPLTAHFPVHIVVCLSL
jgi:hypothetical protein